MRGTRVGLFMAVVLALVACTSDEGGEDDTLDDDEAAVDAGAQDDTDDTEDSDETTDDEDADASDDTGSDLLAEVQDRGELRCGVNEEVPGFGFLTEDGELEGFDVDYCRVIAAAVLGDAEAVDLIPIGVDQRFTALQSGEIDVLSRNTTWTAGRDGNEGAAFTVTTFYDGQGMMVSVDSEFEELEDMENTAICVLQGTTTAANLATRFADIEHEPVTFDNVEQIQEAFIEGACDGWTSDKSQLAGRRSTFPDSEGGPDALRILDETFSKEPLGPLVADGDQAWYDAVNWAVIATIQAEEFGITSDNLADFDESDDPLIAQFLGQEDPEEGTVFDPGLDLDLEYARNVVEQVGNYGEIYDRNVGPDTNLGLERGLNALWTDGGLHYPPPYRP